MSQLNSTLRSWLEHSYKSKFCQHNCLTEQISRDQNVNKIYSGFSIPLAYCSRKVHGLNSTHLNSTKSRKFYWPREQCHGNWLHIPVLVDNVQVNLWYMRSLDKHYLTSRLLHYNTKTTRACRLVSPLGIQPPPWLHTHTLYKQFQLYG